MSPARRLLQYLARYRTRYLVGAACLACATAFSLGIPWAVKTGVDSMAAAGTDAPIGTYALVIVALAVGHGLARFASRFAMIGAGQWVEHDLRRDIFERLQELRPAFYQAHRTGDLMSRASNDVSTVRMLAGFGTTMVAQTSLAFGGTILAMWLIDPWLTLWALAPFPALVVLTRRFGHVVEAQSASVQDQLGVLSAKVQENLTGMMVVRAYTMEEREIATFAAQSREYLARSLALAKSQAAYWPLMGLISGLGTVIVLWAGGKAVVEGRLTLGALVAFNGYLGYLAWPTIALGWTLANVRRGLAAMERIGEILDAPPDGDDGAAPARERVIAAPVPSLAYTNASSAPALEFRDLTFVYDARGLVLRGVSFGVPTGSLVAVVGPTGSGKSTLGALVCRLFDPPRGSIFLDGVDVRDLPLTALRRAVAYVPQEPFLFSRSIRANLLLSDEDASEDRMLAAARAAGLSREVEGLPERWETVVGERGLTLSGGQRQRVALGRALVGEPRVLILDDPFASVDPAMETDIMEAILAARRGRTTLLITHRLRAVREADWVVALEDGAVAEQGPPSALAAADGLYARLLRVQQIEDTLAQD